MIVNQETPLVLYGAATMGGIVYSNLTANKYHVLGFFDKRADEINEYMNLPVFQYQKTDCVDQDKVVILITVKNVFEHSAIAKELLQYGYSNLIFFPIEILERRGLQCHLDMEANYQYFVSKDFEGDRVVKLEPLTKEFFQDPIQTIVVLEESDQTIVAPLFVGNLMVDKDRDHVESREINVLLLQPHIKFFQFMLGEAEGEMESYMDYCIHAAQENDSIQRTERWKENVISNRRDIFARLEYGSMLDSRFLIQKAPMVKWNPNGYFNLLSGKHRCAYFISKKQFYIPVKMSKDDFFLWQQASKAKLQNDLELAKKTSNLIFENPFLYQKIDSEKCFQHLLLFHIAAQIHEYWNVNGVSNTVNHKKILLVGESMNQIIEEFFTFMGAEVDSYDLAFREQSTGNLLNATSHFYDLGISFIKESSKYCKNNIFILQKEDKDLKLLSHTLWNNQDIWIYQGEK